VVKLPIELLDTKGAFQVRLVGRMPVDRQLLSSQLDFRVSLSFQLFLSSRGSYTPYVMEDYHLHSAFDICEDNPAKTAFDFVFAFVPFHCSGQKPREQLHLDISGFSMMQKQTFDSK
jgi:hypothetical protein